MSKQKKHRSFFKIKEKLVFVPSPKKFFGLKIAGIFLVLLGLVVLFLGFFYWYFSPKFFQDKPVKIIEVEKQLVFVPQRLVFPAASLDLQINDSTVEGDLKFDSRKVNNGEEIFIFGEMLYRRFLVSEIQTELSSASANFELKEKKIELRLPLLGKPAKTLTIKADLIE